MYEQNIAVHMADGRDLTAVADQRDLAAFEAQYPDGGGQFTQVRFMAWSALSRAKLVSGPWEKFNGFDCVEASDPKPDEVEVLDPTTPAASAGSS